MLEMETGRESQALLYLRGQWRDACGARPRCWRTGRGCGEVCSLCRITSEIAPAPNGGLEWLRLAEALHWAQKGAETDVPMAIN